MTKDDLANLIEDYAAARQTGRPSVIAPFAKALNDALNELFKSKPEEPTDSKPE